MAVVDRKLPPVHCCFAGACRSFSWKRACGRRLGVRQHATASLTAVPGAVAFLGGYLTC